MNFKDANDKVKWMRIFTILSLVFIFTIYDIGKNRKIIRIKILRIRAEKLSFIRY